MSESAIRTQIYLSLEQRRRIDEVAAREGLTMAEVVRRALEDYLRSAGPDAQAALDHTFGVESGMSVPDRGEWDRG
ncbi:MAG: CopG family transcriptional regulator [Nocardioidaceae bacterium]